MRYFSFIVILLAALTASNAWAEDESFLFRKGAIDLNLGAGVTYNFPARFDAHISGEYFATDHISVGLAADALIRSPHMFTLIPFGRYHFDINSMPEFSPYVGMGVGGRVDTDKNVFIDLVAPNVGFKYFLSKNVAVGPDAGLHILPVIKRETTGNRVILDVHLLFVTSIRF